MARRRIVLALSAAAFVAAGVSTSFLAHAATTKTNTSTPKGASGTFQGVITKVSGNTIHVDSGTKDKPKVTSFIVDKNATVSGGGKQGTIADLFPGLSVTVKAKNGHAESIEVTVKKDDKPADPPTTKPADPKEKKK